MNPTNTIAVLRTPVARLTLSNLLKKQERLVANWTSTDLMTSWQFECAIPHTFSEKNHSANGWLRAR
jgi:hypothetical protein